MTSRRQLIPFAALSASYFAHVGFFNPYLPLWLQDQGFGIFTISLLTSVQAMTRLFAPYAWGALSDHTGERVRLLRWGAAVATVTSLGLWFNFDQKLTVALSVAWLFAVLVIMFTHTSAMMSMSEAAMAHLVSAGGSFNLRRYGRVRLWGSAGFLVTVLLAGAWFEHFGMRHFPQWTTLTLLAVALSTWVMPDLREAVHPDAAKPSIWPVLRQRATQWLFVSMFFHVLAHMGIYIFLSLYLDKLGYSKVLIGLMWAVSVVVEIAWFFTQSRWLPRLILPNWLVLCAAVMVLRMGLTAPFAQVLPLLLLAQALHAVTFAAHHSVCIALLSERFSGRLRGRGQALFTVVAYGLPGVLGGVAGGYISTHYGLAFVFWACAVTAGVAVACAWRFRAQTPH